MKKIIYSAVIYSSIDFNLFIKDYLESVFFQSYNKFELLLILDDVEKSVVEFHLSPFIKNNIKVHIIKFSEKLTPIELRKKQIEISYEMESDILIFSDFDESVAINRVEEVEKNISGYAFAFNDFYIVDKNLEIINESSFFQTRSIPEVLVNYKDILSYNFVGLGSVAINLKEFDFKSLEFPKNIEALDWYVATKVLFSGGKGVALSKTYANYRQYEKSFVGFDFQLNKIKLNQGMSVKLNHYRSLRFLSNEFNDLYNEIIELESFIRNIGEEKYIQLVNGTFNTANFCWWENIKTKKDLNL